MAHNRLACSGKSPAPAFCALVVPGHCSAGRCASDLFKTTASFRFGWLRLLPGPSLASLRSRLSRHILASLRYSTVRPLQLANSFTGQVSASVPKGTRHRASERTVLALISPTTVARQYGVSPMQLRQWRRRGIGPEYFQFTARTVSYSDDYLRDWFNDPRNAHLLTQDLPAAPDMSCQDGRVRRSRPRDDR